MIALKSFENKVVGKIKAGQTLSDRVLRSLDVKSLEKAGFIGKPKTENKKKVDKK